MVQATGLSVRPSNATGSLPAARLPRCSPPRHIPRSGDTDSRLVSDGQAIRRSRVRELRDVIDRGYSGLVITGVTGRRRRCRAVPGLTVVVSPLSGPGFGTDPTQGHTLFSPRDGTRESVVAVGSPTALHDIHSVPNGNADVALGIRSSTGRSHRVGELWTRLTIADCLVQEVDPSGALVLGMAGAPTTSIRRRSRPSRCACVVGYRPSIDVSTATRST